MNGYNLSLKTKTFGNEVNIFDSQDIRWIRGAITIDASTVGVSGVDENGVSRKVLKAGYPLGKITATGKYGPYDANATDGRQKAVCMIATEIDCTYGDQVTTAFDHARVIEARLPIPITQQIKNDLKNIDFV